MKMNPLAQRLTYRIMVVVLVMMAVITGVMYYSVRTYLFEETQVRYEGMLLRTLAALRLLRDKPNYTIAVVAEEAGFASVRTFQRRIQEVVGMSPVDYRLIFTRDQ